MIRINDTDVDAVLEFVDIDQAGDAVYHYSDKPFSGIIESFYPNGKLQDESEYKDGHIGGIQREYYENGQLEEEYYQHFGRLDIHYKKWNESGDLIIHSIWEKGIKIKSVVEP